MAQFVERACLDVGRDELSTVAVTDDLIDALGLDSLDLVLLAATAEDLAEPDALPPEPPILRNLQDAYDYYCALMARRC
jgi:hypothetical protein